ncbi:MAG: Protein transport protein S9 plasma membrane t-SNARE [Piccolia ochrophora]|nr:MAG: Protein transport protein S9 plasma membrane t-SNARE [Piccolia ochrophora]
MKKFGFGKKGSDADEDSSRSALFGSRSSKNASPAPASSNPYAQAPNPASDPYAQDTNKYAGMGQNFNDQGRSSGGRPGPARGGSGGPPSNPRGQSNDNRYGASSTGYASGGYGSDRYGQQSGYAGKRDDGRQQSGGGSRYGPSGYGGLGRADSQDTDDNRDALFGGAQDRYKQRGPQSRAPGGYAQGEDSGAQPGAYGEESGGYGAYGEDRQLTAEEEEEEDVQASKQEIRFMKQEDVSSTRNALRIAEQAEETGRGTLNRLGAQGERIHNTEKNLDVAANHNRVAEERAKELKTLNKSMFAVHVSNPFTKGSRRQQRDDDVANKHRTEREQREATRAAAFDSKARVDGAVKGLQPGDAGYKPNKTKSSLAERAKYQFEADSEDDEMENEIDSNLDALGGAAGRLNALARATGKEVDEQNVHIDRITSKSDKVDDQIAMNRARLDRIH